VSSLAAEAQRSVLRDLFCGRFLSMSTTKEDVQELLRKLPDDCSLEDVQYHLYIIEKVRNGFGSGSSARRPESRRS